MNDPLHRFGPILSPLLAALACLGLGACAKDRPVRVTPSASMTNPTGDRSRFPVVHEDWAKIGYRLDWVGFPFPGATPRTRVVAFAPYEDIVVAQRDSSLVSVLEAGTGQVRWSTELTGPLTKWVGITREPDGEGRIIVSSESEIFILATGTGNLLGRERFARVVNTPPLLHGTLVIGGTSTGVVQAHRLGGAMPAWAFSASGSIDVPLVHVGATISAISQAGEVMFFTPTGSLAGRGRIYGAVDCAPATDGERLFIAGRDQSLWAFSPTGSLLWRYRTSNPLKVSPTCHDGTVYCDLGAEGLSALDPASGSVRWSNREVHGRVIGVRAGRLLVWNGAALSTLDPATGDMHTRVPLSRIRHVAPDAFVDGNLYAFSDDALLARFVPR
jgi:outer membrane protein assembly factor BamB